MAKRLGVSGYLVLLLGLVGCIDPAALPGNLGDEATPESSTQRPLDALPPADAPRVFLLRGLWDVFSLGLDDLSNLLRAEGIETEILSGPKWPDLGWRIEEAYLAGARRPLVLIGHSFGGDDAVKLASYLNDRGIPVRALLLIDSTAPNPVPANVERCVHWYIPTPWGLAAPDAFAGNPAVSAPGNDYTELVNQEFTQAALGSEVGGTDHFSIDSSPFLHKLVIDEINGLAASDATRAKSRAGEAGGD